MNLFELYAVLSLDNKDYKKSLGETESYTQTAGQKIQSVLGKLVSLQVIEQAGKALVNLTKDAVSSYGEYEQLVGGMETLFKENSDQMVKYANEAYKTAQISANDYMSTVTSFSASLLASVGGDTAKAGEMANNAIIDMADNANKMGTAMESIQNAYKGFAKGQYNMLDNLQLGYGGTKEEMQRLLEDAQKLSGQKYDLSSFADITEAIHVIQTELGITGTSAKEATSTIQGSFNMMKSAWENLKVAMVDPSSSIDGALNNVIESVSAFGSNVLPAVQSALGSIATALPSLAQTLLTQLPPMIQSLLPTLLGSIEQLITNIIAVLPSLTQAIFSAIPSLISSLGNILMTSLPTLINTITEIVGQLVPVALQIFEMLAQDLPNQIPVLVESVLTAVQGLADTLAENAPIIIQGAMQMFLGLVDGLTQALPTIIAMLPTIITTLANIINDNMPLILKCGVELIVALVKGIVQAIPTLVANIPQIIEAIVAVWSAMDWINLGKNAINLLKDGILALKGAVSGAGRNILDAVVTALKNLPSKLMEIGKGGINGMINGIKGMISSLISTAGTLMLDLVQKFGSFSLTSVGKDLIQGLINGVGSMAGALTQAVTSLAQGAIDKIKEKFGIASPSKVMKQIGVFCAKGLEIGMETFDFDGYENFVNDMSTSASKLSRSAVNTSTSSQISSMDLADAIRDALDGYSVKLNDREMGRLVRSYV